MFFWFQCSYLLKGIAIAVLGETVSTGYWSSPSVYWHNTHSAFMKHRPWILLSVGKHDFNVWTWESVSLLHSVWPSISCKIHRLEIKSLQSNCNDSKLLIFFLIHIAQYFQCEKSSCFPKWFKNLKHLYISLYSKLYIQNNILFIFMLCLRC